LFFDINSFDKIRFVDEDDIAWFAKTFRRMAEEELGPNFGFYIQKTNYFVDFPRCFHDKISLKSQRT
jgi:hypothetical protein